MSTVHMRELLEAGAHFGHQTRFWHPKMAPFIYGQRNKIHIINLDQTVKALHEATNFIGGIAARGGKILFVGTKRAAQETIAKEADRAGMPYVNRRWLGGMLTNFKTVKQSIQKLRDSEALVDSGGLERMSKKEGLNLTREVAKLNQGLGGIKNMENLPDALFVVDVGFERIAVAEAGKLGIPVVGIVDTNNSPEGLDYVIPGNDDAIRSIGLYAKAMTDSILDGRLSSMHDRGGLEEFVEVESPSQPSDTSNISQEDIASPQDVPSKDADSQIQVESTQEAADGDAVTSNADNAPDGEGEQAAPPSTAN